MSKIVLHASLVFYHLLTLETVACPRNGLQPFGFYLRSALHALAEGSLTNSFKSLLEHLDRLPCSSRFERTSLPFVLSGGLISGIRVLNRTRPHLLLSVGNNALGFRNVIFKNALEALGSIRWQADALNLSFYRAAFPWAELISSTHPSAGFHPFRNGDQAHASQSGGLVRFASVSLEQIA